MFWPSARVMRAVQRLWPCSTRWMWYCLYVVMTLKRNCPETGCPFSHKGCRRTIDLKSFVKIAQKLAASVDPRIQKKTAGLGAGGK